jgi:hypothetical protein
MPIAAPVSQWEPDGPYFDNPFAIEALNVIPKKQGYGPVPAFGSVTGALNARCQGTFFARKSDTTGVIFAGDATKLYRLPAGNTGAWTDVSRVAGGAYNCPSDGHWTFVQFGTNVLAFNGSDVPQTFNVDSSTNFAALGGSSPTALYAAIVGDFVMAGNLGALGRSTVQWSAINDCTNWVTSQQTEADNQILPDGGSVQALFGYNYSATILQEFGIKVATYEGPNLIFRFSKISEGLGCSIPGSAAQYQDRVFFYSHAGLYMLQANSVLTPIGEQRVNNWFKRNLNQTYAYRCCAAVDPIRGVYVLGFPDQTSSGAINHFLTYNYMLDQWTHGQPGNLEWLQTGVTQAPWTIEQLAVVFGTIENVPYPLDSVVWTGTAIPMLGAFDTNHTLGYFNGPNMPATVTTTEMNLVDAKKAFVRGLRPILQGASPPAISISLGTRDLQTNQSVFGPVIPMDQFGYCRFRSKARYHEAKIMIAGGGNWDVLLGADDPLFVPFGTR